MSQAYRPIDEQYLTALSALTARVSRLERSSAGMPGTLVFSDAALTLSNVYQDVSGTTITVSQPGRYFLLGMFDFDWQTASAGVIAFGKIVTTGASSTNIGFAFSDGNAVNRKTLCCFGTASWATTGTMNLQAEKSAALGVCVVQNGVTTSLMAFRTGPA